MHLRVVKMDEIDYTFLCSLLKENLTYTQISDILKQHYPDLRGLSVPSIKLFCKNNGLSSKVRQQEVNEMVRTAVEEVSVIFLFFYYNI